MARVLIVGGGGRAAGLARALAAAGHAVRSAAAAPDAAPELEAAGAEVVSADLDRLATLVPHLEGVSILAWLLGDADGPPDRLDALHGERLESLLLELVDTPVRGFLYEAAGPVGQERFLAGTDLVRRVTTTHAIPLEVVTADPAAQDAWVSEASGAIDRLLSP